MVSSFASLRRHRCTPLPFHASSSLPSFAFYDRSIFPILSSSCSFHSLFIYALHSVIRFLFNSEILSLILDRVYSLSNLLRRIYIFASYWLQFDSYLMDEIQSWTTLAQGSRKWLLFDWEGNTKYMDLFDFVKATDTTKVNHWRNCTFFAQFSFLVIDSCKLIKTLVLLRS